MISSNPLVLQLVFKRKVFALRCHSFLKNSQTQIFFFSRFDRLDKSIYSCNPSFTEHLPFCQEIINYLYYLDLAQSADIPNFEFLITANVWSRITKSLSVGEFKLLMSSPGQNFNGIFALTAMEKHQSHHMPTFC